MNYFSLVIGYLKEERKNLRNIVLATLNVVIIISRKKSRNYVTKNVYMSYA